MGTFGTIARGIGQLGSDLGEAGFNLAELRRQQFLDELSAESERSRNALAQREQAFREKQAGEKRPLGIVNLPGGGTGVVVQDPASGTVSLTTLRGGADAGPLIEQGLAALPKDIQARIAPVVRGDLAVGDVAHAFATLSSVNERLITQQALGSSSQKIWYTTGDGKSGLGFRNPRTGVIVDAATNQPVTDVVSALAMEQLPTYSQGEQTVAVVDPNNPLGPPVLAQVPTHRESQRVAPGAAGGAPGVASRTAASQRQTQAVGGRPPASGVRFLTGMHKAIPPQTLANVSKAIEASKNAQAQLETLIANSGVLKDPGSAAKVALAASSHWTLQQTAKLLGLTPEEQNYAAAYISLGESINTLRASYQATGFRGPEAFDMLMNQRGPLFAPTGVSLGVMRNSLEALRSGEQAMLRSIGGAGQAGPAGGAPAYIYARDPQGNLQRAPAGTPLPKGWKAVKGPGQ